MDPHLKDILGCQCHLLPQQLANPTAMALPMFTLRQLHSLKQVMEVEQFGPCKTIFLKGLLVSFHDCWRQGHENHPKQS